MDDQTDRARATFLACRDLDSAPNTETLLDWLDEFARLEPVRTADRTAIERLRLAPGARVLEVGCGTGVGAAELLAAGYEVTALDVSQAALERARAIAPRATLVRADACDLPFEDASFDAVRLTRVLQHIDAPERALREAYRVLLADGALVAIEGSHTGEVCTPVSSLSAPAERGWVGRFLPLLVERAGFERVRTKASHANLDDGLLRFEFCSVAAIKAKR